MTQISTLLREARESRDISIKTAAKSLKEQLKVREQHIARYIEMLEDGRVDELSKEIYLKGFLKTYTGWLKIDSGEVLSQINQENKKITMQRNAFPINLGGGLSYISDIARRPGMNVFVASLVMTFAIYIFWYNNNKNKNNFDILTVFQQPGQNLPAKYTNILIDYQGKDLVLVPKQDIELKILDTNSNSEKSSQLTSGDVFFIKADDATVISVNAPDTIEVFIDNSGEQQFIGTLDNVLMKL